MRIATTLRLSEKQFLYPRRAGAYHNVRWPTLPACWKIGLGSGTWGGTVGGGEGDGCRDVVILVWRATVAKMPSIGSIILRRRC
jgi:hypothetical protein